MSRKKLRKRFKLFNDDGWEELFRESQAIADEANSEVVEEETTPA